MFQATKSHKDSIQTQSQEDSLLEDELTNLPDKNIQKKSLQFFEESTHAWLENSPVCTKIVDPDLNLQYMSSSGIDDLKIKDINEYYGQPYPLSFYPDSFKIPMIKNLMQAKETGEIMTQEAYVLDVEGEKIWYHSTLVPVFDVKNQLEYIMVVSMNITEKKQSEITIKRELNEMEAMFKLRTAELYQSEERFSLAMKGANDGLWDWNIETNDVYYSPRWKSMLGYEENELDNNFSSWESLVHPDDKKNVLKKVQDYLAGRVNSFSVEMRMRHKNGKHIYILSRAFLVHCNSDKKPVRLVGTHVEITERKKNENFSKRNTEILEMIAIGRPASEIYDSIALMYEERHPGMRCSLLELHGRILIHGGAPSMPKEYCDAINGLENGPEIGSCGSSTYKGKRVVVENIETDPKWKNIKSAALPHGLRSCWSEPIKHSSGKVLGAFGMYYNYPGLPNESESNDLLSAARLAGIIMERDQDQKRIRQLAYSDELTGLASRAHFYQYINNLIKAAEQHGRLFSLLYIDLDDFKSVNDSLGHYFGDQLLKEVARRLESISCDIEFVARLSGDEFCMIVEKDSDDISFVSNLAERCLDIISQPVELSSRRHTSTCSIGIANYPDDGTDTSELLKAADTSLYFAKEQGKNTFAFYRPQFTQEAEYRFKFEQYLREAIEKQQLSLVYQPQVHLRSGEIIGVEALSRWNHPDLGQVSPVYFIDVAERIGMIKPLTEWVLRTACRQAIFWKKAGIPSLRVAVNISPSHFLDKDIVPLISHILDETGMNPNELELEVTERVVQTNPENFLIFQELKDLGVLVAIDDFGTGYSSFSSLKHIKFDGLKIDKYFLDDMCDDSESQLLVGSMINMGHILGYGITAEGIETSEQLDLLKEIDCDTGQGYFFSKPVSSEDITKLLTRDTVNYEEVTPTVFEKKYCDR